MYVKLYAELRKYEIHGGLQNLRALIVIDLETKSGIAASALSQLLQKQTVCFNI